MSRGKNSNGFQRGNRNRTLAWYMGVDSNNQERENAFSPVMNNKRKNSLDSEGSNGRQSGNENEERKRRANKAKNNRQRSQNSQSDQVLQNADLNVSDEGTRSNPIPIGGNNTNDALVGSDQQSAAVLQQQLLALSAQAAVQKENYWYYDPSSDGYFYEYCGSRGWRKRNQKLHGNPPNIPSKLAEEQPTQNVSSGPQTIEKKVYVPIPVPVFPSNKFFSPGTSPNIKYFDSNGFYYETPHAEIWKKRSSTIPSALQQHGVDQRSKFEPSSLTSFPPLGRDFSRDFTNQELEDLILAKVKNTAPNQLNNQTLPFASIVSRNLKNAGIQQRQPEPEYPSSSSTVSSAVSDDTPPPVAIGKENQQLFAQTKEPCVGSFDEPYEFYWSDSEKTDNVQQEVSSVSSMDDYHPLNAYLNDLHVTNPMIKQNIRVQRPSSLKISNPPMQASNDNRLPRFNVDKFIADLPGNDNFMNGMYAPFGVDSPRTPFNNSQFVKNSPMFTPMIKEHPWRQFPTLPVDEVIKEKASADIERGLRDIEKIWQTS